MSVETKNWFKRVISYLAKQRDFQDPEAEILLKEGWICLTESLNDPDFVERAVLPVSFSISTAEKADLYGEAPSPALKTQEEIDRAIFEEIFEEEAEKGDKNVKEH